MELPSLVQRTLQRLIHAFGPERVVLYGSYAKGTTHPLSDVDLLVVTNISGDAATRRRRARQLSQDCFPRVDVVFATPEEITTATTLRSPFLASIIEKGVVVYERGSATIAGPINRIK